jgi:hypothetical protein
LFLRKYEERKTHNILFLMLEVAGSLLSIQSSLEMAPLGFPHTMLNVKMVKHNMRLAFIEKLFTNRKIGTGV